MSSGETEHNVTQTVGMVRFTDLYRYIRMNIYEVVASMTEVCIKNPVELEMYRV